MQTPGSSIDDQKPSTSASNPVRPSSDRGTLMAMNDKRSPPKSHCRATVAQHTPAAADPTGAHQSLARRPKSHRINSMRRGASNEHSGVVSYRKSTHRAPRRCSDRWIPCSPAPRTAGRGHRHILVHPRMSQAEHRGLVGAIPATLTRRQPNPSLRRWWGVGPGGAGLIGRGCERRYLYAEGRESFGWLQRPMNPGWGRTAPRPSLRGRGTARHANYS
jgi:hypothetical protein